MIYFIAD